jgi:hypothetical protein
MTKLGQRIDAFSLASDQAKGCRFLFDYPGPIVAFARVITATIRGIYFVT